MRKMKSGAKYLTFPLFITALTLSLVIAAVSALASPGLLVSNAICEQTVSPGDIIRHTMAVGIRGDDQPVDVHVEARGVRQKLDGGYRALEAEEDGSPYSARTFITNIEPASFHLEPGTSQKVTVTITVPNGVGDGGRYAIIYIYTDPIGDYVFVPVMLTIKNTKLIKTGDILSINVGQVVPGKPILTHTIFGNTGNCHYKARTQVMLTDEEKHILATTSTPISYTSIIPLHAFQFNAELTPTQELPPGTYYVTSVVTLEDGTVLNAKRVGFVIPSVKYNLSISSTAGGSVTTPGEGTVTYYEGSVVNLVAAPDDGYRFVNWTGDVDTITNVGSAKTTIAMKGNYTIQANFEAIGEAPTEAPAEAPGRGIAWIVGATLGGIAAIGLLYFLVRFLATRRK